MSTRVLFDTVGRKRKFAMDKILKLLEDDAALTTEQLAAMLDKDPAEVGEAIRKYEADGVILGYKTLIDWEKVGGEDVTAIIEVKVMPQRDCGFDRIAEKIANYPEVKSLFLMSSGGFDLALIIEGKTMKEIAHFVARKLSGIESVTATATHFVLRKYKDKGVIYGAEEVDERGIMPL